MFKRLALIAAGVTAAAVIAATAFAVMPAKESSAAPVIDAEEQAFLTLLNNYRAQNGRGPVQFNTSIQGAAEWMSNDMAVKRYFSHTDSLGRSPWTRMCNFGYCYSTYKGENIAAGYTTASAVFNAWKNSSGHNANMLNANFKVVGIGRVCVAGSPYGCYWTNDFGGYVAPNSAPPPAATATPVRTATPKPPTATPVRTAAPTPLRTPTPTPVRFTTATPVKTAAPTLPGGMTPRPTRAPTR